MKNLGNLFGKKSHKSLMFQVRMWKWLANAQDKMKIYLEPDAKHLKWLTGLHTCIAAATDLIQVATCVVVCNQVFPRVVVVV